MSFTTRDYQARVNAIFNQEVLKVDGMNGPQTRKWIDNAMKSKKVSKQEDIFHDSRLHGIIWHWTASRYEVTQDDLKHYNNVHDYQGNSYDGVARAEHQANYNWRRGIGVSHTKNANTGRIGQAVSAMHGAVGWPTLNWGNFPLTWAGIDAMLQRSAEYCKEFDIPISRWSTLSHAEVERTLGIEQENKWDFMVLPGMPKVGDAIEVGDILRDRLREKFL